MQKNKSIISMHILFQGSVAYNGQDIAFRVAETEQKQLQISVSFVKGSNTNQAKFEFNKVEENHWTLDREKTKSDINLDLKYDNTNDKWIFGTDNLLGVGNIEMILKKKQEELEKEEKFFNTEYSLTIEKDGKELEDLTELECSTEESEIEATTDEIENSKEEKSKTSSSFKKTKNNTKEKPIKISNDGSTIHWDLDKTIEAIADNMGPVRKFFTLPVIKGLCNDLERTIEEKVLLQSNSKDKEVSQDKKVFQNKNISREKSATSSVGCRMI